MSRQAELQRNYVRLVVLRRREYAMNGVNAAALNDVWLNSVAQLHLSAAEIIATANILIS